MRNRARALCAVVVTLAAFLPPLTATTAYADGDGRVWGGESEGDEIRIRAESAVSSDSVAVGGAGGGLGRVYRLCDPVLTMRSGEWLMMCATGQSRCVTREGGGPAYAFVFWPDSGGGLMPDYVRCVIPEEVEEPLAVTASDFAVMRIPAPVAVRQPAKPESLVNVALIVYAEPGVQVFTATVLGEVVSIRATPVAYSWDFRDPYATGSNPSVVYSRSSGRPYPNHTIAHTYTRPGWVSQSLTTTYRGEYAISANPVNSDWIPIPGTAQNTVEIPAHEVVETRPQLEESR